MGPGRTKNAIGLPQKFFLFFPDRQTCYGIVLLDKGNLQERTMTEGFSNEQLTGAKNYGFLKRRLGKRIIYCNRPDPKTLWYERIDNENVAVDALSFLSKPKEGMVGLKIYAAERWGETSWKMGLFLRGEQNQVIQFECGLHTVFAKGLMWGFCAANAEEVRSGEIGINPMPADPTKSKSKNPEKILYCNIFINGEEMPYFPGGTEHNWRELAIVAMTKCNGYPPVPEEIPDNEYFMNEKQVEKYNKQYGSEPRTQKTQQSMKPANLQQQAPVMGEDARSGVSYPIQPQNATKELQATASSTIASVEDWEELSASYSHLIVTLDEAYLVNGMKIDGDRMQKVLDHCKVADFDHLSVPRKHQIVCTLAKELIEVKAPEHKTVSQLAEMVKANPVNAKVLENLKEILASAFGGTDLIPF